MPNTSNEPSSNTFRRQSQPESRKRSALEKALPASSVESRSSSSSFFAGIIGYTVFARFDTVMNKKTRLGETDGRFVVAVVIVVRRRMATTARPGARGGRLRG